jgi:flagellar biosynthesis/type III secretory pathway M-ring protein FliF/YscJ
MRLVGAVYVSLVVLLLIGVVVWVATVAAQEALAMRRYQRKVARREAAEAEQHRIREEKQRWEGFATFHRRQAEQAEAEGDAELAWVARLNAERFAELARQLNL